MKTCTKCMKTKSLAEFGRHNQTKDGLKSRCKICHAAESRASRRAHIEKARAREREYHHANREERNAKFRARKAERKYGPGKINKEAARKRSQRWKVKNRDKVNEDTAYRRATKLKATPNWADRNKIREIYQMAARLGKEVDHIIPLRNPAVCGLHWEGNLQLLDPIDNARKGNTYADTM